MIEEKVNNTPLIQEEEVESYEPDPALVEQFEEGNVDPRSFLTSYMLISDILDPPSEGRLSVDRCILTQSQEEDWR